MSRTSEQQGALVIFWGLVSPLRLRVTTDLEGWPIIQGRVGQLEWHEPTTVAVYSRSMRMLAKLAQIPGLRRHQIGDTEFRLLLPLDGMHDKDQLRGVSRLLRLRTRRILTEPQKAALVAGQKRFQSHNQSPQSGA